MARNGDKRQTGGLEGALAPVAGVIVLGAAMGRAVLDRRHENENANGDGNSAPAHGEHQPPPAEHEPLDREDVPPRGIKGKLVRLGERWSLLGRILDVHQRYGDLKGNNLSAAVAFQAFVSLFPLLLVIVAVIGFVTVGSSVNVAGKIIGNLGLDGDAARAVRDAVTTATESRKAASVVGLAGLFWSGLGLVNALQYAFDQAWQVEERGIKDKAVGVGWLLGAAVLFVAASAVTTVINWLPGFVAPVGIAVGLLVNFGLWLWTHKVLPNVNIPWRRLVPGAILGAVGMEALKLFGGIYVPKAVANSSELYGSLGLVFAILAWLLLFSRLVLYSATLNVVLYERKVGTIKTTIEVPATPNARPDQTTRSGRVEKEDIAS